MTEPATAESSKQELPDTESLILTYQSISEWIRFADAKAAVVLTVNGALAGLLIPTLRPYLNAESHPTAWWSVLVTVLFAAWMLFLGIASIWAFRCILPFTQGGRHPALEECKHFHPAAVAQEYQIGQSDTFEQNFGALGVKGFKHEVIAGILIDSHVSRAKYIRVTRSIKLLALGAIFGLMYLVAIQF